MPTEEQEELSMVKRNNDQQIKQTWAALLVVFVILALIVAMIWSTEGDLSRAHMILLYVGVAIITGILFWHFTPGSTGQFDLKQLGIRLGGGAAIGASFMVLAWWLTVPETTTALVFIPTTIPDDFKIENISPEKLADLGKVHTKSRRNFIFADFRAGHESALIRLTYLNIENNQFLTPVFKILLTGQLIPTELRQEDPVK